MAKPVYKFLEVFYCQYGTGYYIPIRYKEIVANLVNTIVNTEDSIEYHETKKEFEDKFGKYSSDNTKLYIRK